MKHARTLRTVLFVLLMVLALLPATALGAGNITYLDEKQATQTCASAKEVTAADTEWTAGWYVADGCVDIPERVTVTGEVHLILLDECRLRMPGGIRVQENGNSFSVYSQSNTYKMGRLFAGPSGYEAGIGTDAGGNGGIITINGGYITARSNAATSDPAAIGGGAGSDAKAIYINGGVIDAIGCNKGIGSGIWAASYCPIYITGGTITANGIGTGTAGNPTSITGGGAVIYLTVNNGITENDKANWNGIVGSGNTMTVYGADNPDK